MTEEPIRRFHAELSKIREAEKCRTCTCFYEVLEDLGEVIKATTEGNLKLIKKDVAEWKKEGEGLKLHGCLGCDPCLPVHPSNQFYRTLKPMKVETSTPSSKSASKAVSNIQWPAVSGAYYVGDKDCPIAICTLSSEEMFEEFKDQSYLKSVAIVGRLSTENIGIEKIIFNVVSNPNIRFLILCGQESRGHYAGQAILSLAENGVDDSGRIIGAKGARPFLRNVTREEIEAFRKKVQVINLIGVTNPESVRFQADQLNQISLPSSNTTPPAHKQTETITAYNTVKGFVQDPLGFFTILAEKKTGEIIMEHYSNDYALKHIIKGKRAEDICATITKLGLVSRLDHSAYLGRELQKAEDSLRLGYNYEQEKI